MQTCTLHNVLEACQDVKWEVSQTCYWLWLAQEVTRRTDWGSLVSWNVTAPPIVYLIVSLTHSHTHTHIHTHTHTHTSTHTHLYTHTLTHRQTHTPLHTHIHTHTHTQTDRHTHTLPSLSPKHNSSTVIHATSKALPAHFLFTEHSRHSHGAKALSVHVAIQSRLDGHTLNQQQAPLFLCSSAYSTRL